MFAWIKCPAHEFRAVGLISDFIDKTQFMTLTLLQEVRYPGLCMLRSDHGSSLPVYITFFFFFLFPFCPSSPQLFLIDI